MLIWEFISTTVLVAWLIYLTITVQALWDEQ